MLTFLSQIITNARTVPEDRELERTHIPQAACKQTKKKPSLIPCQEASNARRQSCAHPSQSHLAGAAPAVGYIWISRFSEDNVCLTTPGAYIADGVCNDMRLNN